MMKIRTKNSKRKLRHIFSPYYTSWRSASLQKRISRRECS